MQPADPPLCWRVLHLPKHGHTAEEYEDAWAADPAAGRFAIADGASESAFANLWARLLTDGFLAARRPRDLAGWLGDARRHWLAEVMGLELPWYAEMKRAEGSFATLLGLNVRPVGPNRPARWRAVAVGDSCLVRVRNDGQVKGFPLAGSSEFDNQPRLIGSRGEMPHGVRYACGSLSPGDHLFLMTDALAQWFLRACEGGGRPWEEIAPLCSAESSDGAFAVWAEELRGSGALRDDDVTLLMVEPGRIPEESPV
jgi:Protein phosphatase 2C